MGGVRRVWSLPFASPRDLLSRVTERLRVDPIAPEAAIIARAAVVIRAGGLVAFPTETVYGLGAHALDANAVRRIYSAKGRPSWNPLIVHTADAASARALATDWPESARLLADAFWPGPLTLVVRKRGDIPAEVTAGLDSVGVRVPSHPVALALLAEARVPIAAPSANRFTRLSPTTAEHVARGLGDDVDIILDGGATFVGIESTVIDVTGDVPTILRPGRLSLERLAAVVGEVRRSVDDSRADDEAPRSSPGMVARHYAPRATVLLFGDDDRERARRAIIAARTEGHRVGALLRTPLDAPISHVHTMPDAPDSYAHALYAELHELEALGCDVIAIEMVPSDGEWAGIRDRLERAAR